MYTRLKYGRTQGVSKKKTLPRWRGAVYWLVVGHLQKAEDIRHRTSDTIIVCVCMRRLWADERNEPFPYTRVLANTAHAH